MLTDTVFRFRVVACVSLMHAWVQDSTCVGRRTGRCDLNALHLGLIELQQIEDVGHFRPIGSRLCPAPRDDTAEGL